MTRPFDFIQRVTDTIPMIRIWKTQNLRQNTLGFAFGDKVILMRHYTNSSCWVKIFNP